MDYKKIYNKLIIRAQSRNIDNEYHERHHIIPKCIGGTNNKDNLVKLTPEEHFLCHVLLVKIYPEHHTLIYAVNKMCQGHKGKRINRTLYGWLKRRFTNTISDNQRGANNSQYGTIWITNGEINKKILNTELIPDGWYTGRVLLHRRGIPPHPMTEEIKEKISINRTGKGLGNTPWNKGKIGEQIPWNKGITTGKQEVVVCPYCNKSGGTSNMTRYHFDNCRYK